MSDQQSAVSGQPLQENGLIRQLREQLGIEQRKADRFRKLFERQRFIDDLSPAARVLEQSKIDLEIVMLTGDQPQPPTRSTL